MGSSASLADYFDIKEKDRLNIAFRSTTADKTMIFSGPPTFSMLGENPDIGVDAASTGVGGHIITPLAFSTSFTVSTSRSGSAEYPVIGSQETFVVPSTTGRINISLGAHTLVSGDPLASTAATNDVEKYTLVKRLYNDVIQYGGGTLVDHFISSGGEKTESGFKPIAAAAGDLFVNFAHSEFYEIEFGILRITLTKGNEGVLVTYYENCKIQGGLTDATRAGGQTQFQPNVSLSSAREVPLNMDVISDVPTGSSDKGFMVEYMKYLSGK